MMHWSHRWRPTKVQHGTQGPYDQSRELWSNITLILYRCRCGRNKIETLDGTWTLDDLEDQRKPTILDDKPAESPEEEQRRRKELLTWDKKRKEAS